MSVTPVTIKTILAKVSLWQVRPFFQPPLARKPPSPYPPLLAMGCTEVALKEAYTWLPWQSASVVNDSRVT
jgi:hypothetical protein